MKATLKNSLLIALGWLSVIAGAIGLLLPIVPTTPFLILALALFSKSSPRFHNMLLENRWFGPTLKQWEESKTLSRKVKYRASALIVIAFSTSVWILHGRQLLQIMLISLAAICLFFIWRIKESR